MKRIISMFIAAALLCQAAIVFAHDSSEPSIKSVLEAARAKYWHDKGSDAKAESSDEEQKDSEGGEDGPDLEEAQNEVPYTPVLFSWVPGVSIPFGYYDASLVGGAIGNLVRDVSGAECAGVFNISRDVRGGQGAGVFNISRNIYGFQSAGVFNIVDSDLRGFQSAGVFNIVDGSVSGFQSAGIFNIAGTVRAPIQVAGIFNIDDEIYGFQGAGIFNIAGSVAGGQVAGIFNKADRVSGVQIGLVNIADHIDGVQLGLVNLAGNGVNSSCVSYEPQTGFAYAYWQAGTPALYTVVGLGAPSSDWFIDFSGFMASFGLGSRTTMFGFKIDLDVSAEQGIGTLPYDSFAWEDGGEWEGWNMIRPYPSIRLMTGLPLGHRFEAVCGLKVDVDVDALGNRVPQALKTGKSWKGSLFEERFTAWPKWFFGLKI
jgi:hypothetical protein